MRDLLLACTLSTDELASRRDELLPGLFDRAQRRERLDAGYRLIFAPVGGLLEIIARTIERERKCCPFLRFELTVDQDHEPFRLDVTGPAGTRELLDDLVPDAGRNPSASSA